MIIIKFSASWCQPCAAYKPTFDKVIKELGVKSESIDVESKPDIGGKHRVMSIPCTIIIDNNGVEVFRKISPISEKELNEVIKEYFKI